MSTTIGELQSLFSQQESDEKLISLLWGSDWLFDHFYDLGKNFSDRDWNKVLSLVSANPYFDKLEEEITNLIIETAEGVIEERENGRVSKPIIITN